MKGDTNQRQTANTTNYDKQHGMDMHNDITQRQNQQHQKDENTTDEHMKDDKPTTTQAGTTTYDNTSLKLKHEE